MIYLDYAAATPLDPHVFEAMKPWMTSEYANPSSVYQSGQRARAAVDAARFSIAQFLHAKPSEIFFTGSGTESCNWAIRGVAEHVIASSAKRSEAIPKVKDNTHGIASSPRQPRLAGRRLRMTVLGQSFRMTNKFHVISSVIEHSSVLKTVKYLETLYGIEVSFTPVNSEGLVQVDTLKKLIRPETKLVSIMFVNNEIGTVQPIEEIGALCKEKGILFHTDACQAAGYFDLNVQKLQVDLLSINAAKIYGPKGIGALYVKEGTPFAPLFIGGDQEFKMRAGTENVAGIVGFGKAVQRIQPSDKKNLEQLRKKLWSMIQKKIPQASLNGSLKNSAPHILSVFLPGMDADTLIKRLDMRGVSISAGSACSSGIFEPSHVLKALGTGGEKESIRISLGRFTKKEELAEFVTILAEEIKKN